MMFSTFGISIDFSMLSPAVRQVTHVLLTRPPLTSKEQALYPFVRLACIRHAASVRPEPGSNSHERFHESIVTHLNTSLWWLFWLAISSLSRIIFGLCFVFLTNPYTIWCLSLFSFQWAFLNSLWKNCFVRSNSNNISPFQFNVNH